MTTVRALYLSTVGKNYAYNEKDHLMVSALRDKLIHSPFTHFIETMEKPEAFRKVDDNGGITWSHCSYFRIDGEWLEGEEVKWLRNRGFKIDISDIKVLDLGAGREQVIAQGKTIAWNAITGLAALSLIAAANYTFWSTWA